MENEGTMTVPERKELKPLAGNDYFFADLFGKSTDNFDGDENQQLKLDLLATNSRCADSDKADGEQFSIRWFHLKRVELLNERTGELNPAVRTTLISPDFRTIDFCSDGVWQSLALIVKRKGMGPWNPSVDVVIRHRKMPSKHTMIVLEPLM